MTESRASPAHIIFARLPARLACRPQLWLTSTMLHQTFMHLLSNSLLLGGFGAQMEMKHGSWRVALLAVLAALGGNLFRCEPPLTHTPAPCQWDVAGRF